MPSYGLRMLPFSPADSALYGLQNVPFDPSTAGGYRVMPLGGPAVQAAPTQGQPAPATPATQPNPFGDPQAMALLGLSQGLLQAGAPSPFPVGIGGALGRGIGGALAGATNAQQMNQRQQLVDLEKAKADMTRQQLAQMQADFNLRRSILAGVFPGLGQPSQTDVATRGVPSTPATPAGPMPAVLTNPDANQFFGAPISGPSAAPAPAAVPAAPAPQSSQAFPFTLPQIAAMHVAGMPDLTGAYNAAQPNIELRNGVMYDKKSGAIVGTVPQTNQQGFSTITIPDKSSPTGFKVEVVPGALPAYLAQQRAGAQAQAERDLVTVPATAANQPPTFASRESLIQGSGKGAPAAGMSPAAASAQAADAAQQSEVAKNYGKIYNDLQNASMANPTKIAKFQRVGQLLEGFEGGKFSQTGLDIAKAANSAGLKIDPKLPNKEAATALANEIALELRSTSSGAGMPGAMSDQDREFLKSMTPQLAQTNEGRKTIIDARVKVMQRENQVADMARQYRKKYGKLDDDFFSQLQAWSAQHQIFYK